MNWSRSHSSLHENPHSRHYKNQNLATSANTNWRHRLQLYTAPVFTVFMAHWQEESGSSSRCLFPSFLFSVSRLVSSSINASHGYIKSGASAFRMHRNSSGAPPFWGHFRPFLRFGVTRKPSTNWRDYLIIVYPLITHRLYSITYR